ncbi:MAG TPA: hypothetical protein VLH56_19175 [Dissulfurispiraceae bacterium]|nr:hypothetical protein [Dissulfurispiraceae bacterium]
MPGLDSINNLAVKLALRPDARTADVNGLAIDTKGYDSLAFTLAVGVIQEVLSDGVMDFTATIQKSATAAFTTAVTLGESEVFDKDGTLGTGATATVFDIHDNADDDTAYSVGVKIDPDYRYYRVVSNFTGTFTYAIDYCILAILSHGDMPDDSIEMNP